MVTDSDADAGADLEFPLAWHNFSICARNLDSSVKASFVVHISNDTPEADVCAD